MKNPFNSNCRTTPSAQKTHSRRGAMIVFLAAMMSLFMIAVIFTVDVAYMQMVKTDVRIAADVSAKAGVEALLRTESTATAEASAKRFLELNTVANQTMKFNDGDIEMGKVFHSGNGNNKWHFNKGLTPYNAMRVTVRLDDNANASVPLFFARFFDNQNYKPQHTSIAANLVHEIVLCIDRSHSMCFDLTGADWSYPSGTPNYPQGYISNPNPSGSRWAKLDGAIQVFVSKIQQRSIKPDIALVTWGSDITLGWSWFPHQYRSFDAVEVDLKLGQNIDQVNAAIATRYNDIMMGGTNMAAGINKAINILKHPSTNSLAQKTIILMSDGMWNTGSNPVTAAQTAAANNITIHTVSFLSINNQSVMQTIATTTGGKSYSALNATQLNAAFEELAEELPIVLID
ncbi:VWA domain-containing protein [uncultured Rubinisphaera sp.]|uniref:VWA domain-containing protein n=1 Tax=uncultured Rubinisphaera sp. TaxID=1678686 RepID=UPI0030DBDEB5